MRGIADQITIIADLMDLSMANFKMAVTKRNIAESLKYSPERQYKLIAINITSFAYYCWMFIQPLLPKHTLSKITIVGTNKNEILDALTKEMSFSVIPEYLGGTNSVTFD